MNILYSCMHYIRWLEKNNSFDQINQTQLEINLTVFNQNFPAVKKQNVSNLCYNYYTKQYISPKLVLACFNLCAVCRVLVWLIYILFSKRDLCVQKFRVFVICATVWQFLPSRLGLICFRTINFTCRLYFSRSLVENSLQFIR